MRIAVLSINIGDYVCFWEEFYKTAEANFLIDCDKEYFVFTDVENIYGRGSSKMHIYIQEDLGWPFNTMKRFHFFMSIFENLKNFDYIFYVNANAMFVYPLSSEIILPNKEIITVEHPGFHYRKKQEAPFEGRQVSSAFVSLEKRKVYVQGAFFGGKREAFFELVKELDELTERDLSRNIIAIWHDESFLNHYVAYHNNVQVLGWQYLKYEECVQPYKPIIMLRNKRRYLTNRNGRFLNENFAFEKVLSMLRNIKWLLLIILSVYRKYEIVDNEGKYKDLNILERV